MYVRYSILFLIILLASCSVKKPQSQSILLRPLKIGTKNKIFRENPPKIVDILHTQLNVTFDWAKHQCMGKETITLTPYYYDLDSFTLDAKNFKFNDIAIIVNGSAVTFDWNYNEKAIKILLNKKISKTDTLQMLIDYTAFPDKNTGNGSKAIKDDKGLYFINTDGAEPFKPMQLWTQGETEANSNWFVTTDKPFEKMLFDINITVPDSMTTLSNGLLVKSENTQDGLRTDYWKMQKPMSAYLVMMAVGKFNKTTDEKWRGKEISYYLENGYHTYAKNIFNHTPEMMEFFSTKLNYEYPWQKYAQVVVRDFVSGAMENTSATLHGDFVQKNNRELIDNQNDGIVAHELFHQWFGDVITCASWSHLTLNEGFATFGEQLWFGHKYGKTAELKRIYNSMNSYLRYAKRNDKAIVRFYYNDKEELFNPITYQKGARVLNLLKFTLGEKAFFEAITNYLNKYEFQTAQIEDLKHEFEKTSGQDLRYFFNQWFLRGGHPDIEISNEVKNGARLIKIKQVQKDSLYSFPFQYRINKETKTILCSKKTTTIKLPNNHQKAFFHPDPQGIFIGSIDYKTVDSLQLVSYFNSAENYIEKMRILATVKKAGHQSKEEEQLLLTALNDAIPDVSYYAMNNLNWENQANFKATKEDLKRIATLSTNSDQKAQAINILSGFSDKLLFYDFENWCKDSSYQVAGAALNAINRMKPHEALSAAQRLETNAHSDLFRAIITVYGTHADSSCTYFSNQLMQRFGADRNHLITHYGIWAQRQGIEEQNKCWQEISDRAQNDQSKWTRYYAMLTLNKLAKKSKHITEDQKVTMTAIFKNEKDDTIKRQLQIKKLIPIETLEK